MPVLCESLVPLRRRVLASGIPRLERQDYARLCAFSWLMLRLSLWRICGAIAQKPPQRNELTTLDLAIKSREAWPHSFMFQYPQPLLTTSHSSFLLPRFQSFSSG